MRKFVVLGIAFLLLLGMVVGTAFAALPGSGWWVFYQIQNVSGTDGTMSMEAFETQSDGTAGDTFSSDSFNIGDGEALAFHPGLDPTYPSGDRIGFTEDLPAGFQGAAVVSSDVEVVAVAEVGNNKSGTVGVDGGLAKAFYQGIGGASASSQVNFPTVKHNFVDQTTTFYVQAAGANADVTIEYNMNDGNSYSDSATIQANHMYIFDPAAAGVPSTNCLPAESSPCLGAANVTSSSGDIVGVVVEHPHSGSPASFALSTRGFTSADEDTTIFAPIIKNDFFGGTTGWSVQNVGNAQTVANITLTVTNVEPGVSGVSVGDQYTDQETIDPGQATVFSKFRDNLGGLPEGVFAAAVVSADQPLVGSINESNGGARDGDDGKAVYASFPQSNSTDEIALPLVKEMFFGNTTGVTVVNAGDSNTQFIATYTDASGNARTFETQRTDIAPGEAIPFFLVNQNLDNRFQGLSDFSVLNGTKNSVVITTSNGEEIVAVAQESDRNNRALDIKNYEGFNLGN